MGGKFEVVITDAEYESHEVEKEVLLRIDAELVKSQCRTGTRSLGTVVMPFIKL